MTCELCDSVGGELLWQSELCRVVLVEDAHYGGFCRVILNAHVKEMTDLEPYQRAKLMVTVFAVEAAVLAIVQPDKVNLASLGNLVPHLHWHVIPRFADDRHFPNPVWGEAKREGDKRPINVEALRQAIKTGLG